MVSKYANTAVYDILGYLWAQMQAEGVLVADDYYVQSYDLNVMPIVPVQEVPELANHLGSKPYMVYDVMTVPTFTAEWWIQKDEVILTIFSQDVGKINEIKNLINDKFRKMDESANRVNTWLDNEGDYIYMCIELVSANISGETDAEYGRTTGEIIISFDYMRRIDANGDYQ